MPLYPFRSTLIADTGISFGDEGKGRLVSEIVRELKQTTRSADPVAIVLKVNGGANSGHTAGGLKLNLLPGGVIEREVPFLALGSGVVADPRKLWWETAAVESRGFPVLTRIRVDERTMVSDLSHRLLDLAWEHYREHTLGSEPRGSTGRGITPAYVDEVAQWQIFFDEFLGDEGRFRQRLARRAERACLIVRHVCGVGEEAWFGFFDQLTQAETRANREAIEDGTFPESEFDFRVFATDRPFELDLERLGAVYWERGRRFADNIVDVRELILDAQSRRKYVIGEFGQSYWLDKRHGFPPNVTASHTFTPEFFNSAGIPVQPIHNVGVCKAYDTKVGTHDFITRMDRAHSLHTKLGHLEFGTSTGRQRMIGWFDSVEKGTALRFGGFDDLVLNKLDALTQGGSWEGKLKVCTAYRAPDGSLFHRVPRSETLRAGLAPVYEEFDPWDEDISAIRRYADLPPAARRYVAGILRSILRCAGNDGSDSVRTPNLRYIGVGPDPDEIISDIPPVREILAS